MTLHASTQMTVTSLEGVKYLEDMGFSRVVLARELSEKEIEHICKNAKAEIEVLFTVQFVCVTPTVPYVEYFRAAEAAIAVAALNRVDYRMILLENGKTVKSGYVLSPKDMALVNDLGH